MAKLSKKFISATIPDHTITKFFGNNTELSDLQAMPDGFSPDSLNWITGTEKDMIALRRGTALLGQTRQGAGKITGLGVGTRNDGTQVPFFSYGRKVNYYDSVSDDVKEVGSNLLPASADGDEVSIAPYQNLAGAFVYLSSINSSVYKIPVANPANAVDQLATDYKGFLKFGQSRSLLFNRKGTNGFTDKNNLYMSWVDAPSLTGTQFANVKEAVGDGGSTHYTYTLAAVTGKKTAFQVFVYSVNQTNVFTGSGLDDMSVIGVDNSGSSHTYKVQISDTSPDKVTITNLITGDIVASHLAITGAEQTLENGITFKFNSTTGHSVADYWTITSTVGESFQDDKNGNLLSNLGSVGTVNYATGVIDLTFASAVVGYVRVVYYTEDATNNGILDYSFASTRIAGTGRFFSQFDGGGALNSVFPLANVFYCFHTLKTWQTTIPTDDDDQGSTPATNLTFREKMGVTYPYSAFGGATGIWYINNSNPNRPEVYQLQLFTGATSANIASPTLISKALNLSSYSFDKAIMFEWGIYVLLCCQQTRNGAVDDFNSRTFLYNKKSGTWDILDYCASRLAEYEGTLIAGDSLTNNIFTLFSGFDDDNQDISNYWTSGATNHDVSGQKVHNTMVVNGLIQSAQKIKVSLSFDGGDFVEVGGKDVNGVHTYAIEGTGSYVDTEKSIAVGSMTEGSKIVGGGSTVYANPFQVEFTVNSPHYEYVRIKLEAVGGGYAQINFYRYKNIRYKGSRSMPVRTI